jgi:hypothetical protein
MAHIESQKVYVLVEDTEDFRGHVSTFVIGVYTNLELAARFVRDNPKRNLTVHVMRLDKTHTLQEASGTHIDSTDLSTGGSMSFGEKMQNPNSRLSAKPHFLENPA